MPNCVPRPPFVTNVKYCSHIHENCRRLPPTIVESCQPSSWSVGNRSRAMRMRGVYEGKVRVCPKSQALICYKCSKWQQLQGVCICAWTCGYRATSYWAPVRSSHEQRSPCRRLHDDCHATGRTAEKASQRPSKPSHHCTYDTNPFAGDYESLNFGPSLPGNLRTVRTVGPKAWVRPPGSKSGRAAA